MPFSESEAKVIFMKSLVFLCLCLLVGLVAVVQHPPADKKQGPGTCPVRKVMMIPAMLHNKMYRQKGPYSELALKESMPITLKPKLPSMLAL